METICGAHRCGHGEDPGYGAGASGTTWDERYQDPARAFRYTQDQAPPAGRRASRENQCEAGISAGIVYFSIAFRGGSGPSHDYHVGESEFAFCSLEEKEDGRGQYHNYPDSEQKANSDSPT